MTSLCRRNCVFLRRKLYALQMSSVFWQASLVVQTVKNLPAVRETWVWSLGQEDPLEEEIATCSSVLAWRTPWTEEPGGLQSVGPQSMQPQRVGHDGATSTTSVFWILWGWAGDSNCSYGSHVQFLKDIWWFSANQIAFMFDIFFSWSLPSIAISFLYKTGMENMWHAFCVPPCLTHGRHH